MMDGYLVQAGMLAGIVMLVGCNGPTAERNDAAVQPELSTATLYLPGMNQELQIL